MFKRTSRDDFLSGLEAWINEVVAQRANGHNDKIPASVRDSFQQSMAANIEFHRDLAKTLDGDGKDNDTLAKYHGLMVEIYSTFMCLEPRK